MGIQAASPSQQKQISSLNKESRIKNLPKSTIESPTLNNYNFHKKSELPKPNASVSVKMAPALTEPLSPTNNLSSSTASASPRPTSITSNSEGIISNNNRDYSNKKSPKSKGDFQLAFEKSVNDEGVIDTEVKSPNGSKTLQMGPMCDTNPIISSNANDTVSSNTTTTNIPIQFVNLSSDFEESIKAEICLRNQLPDSNLNSNRKSEFSSPPHMDFSANSCDESSEQQNEEQLQKKTSRNQIIIHSILELPRINTDSTVTASECDNIEENLSQLDAIDEQQSPQHHQLQSPPRTPNESSSLQQNCQTSSLTPQSQTSSTMGLQKDFIKDSVEMDQVLGDMDLLQVLKGFDSTPGNEALCDLAGSLGLFNDVDVMNYEEISAPVKDSEAKEIRSGIEKVQLSMQRKVDFLLRRLRKMQSRYMCKQTTEEISGLFEWTTRTIRRKDEANRQLTYEDEKRYPVTITSVRTAVKKIESIAGTQHLSQVKRSKVGRPSNTTGPAITLDKHPPLSTYVPRFDENVTENMSYVASLLQTEMKEVQYALDSEATASSSGGESADEGVPYNNTTQQPLTIARRAAWRYALDRGAIAARWSWLLSQISDLEFKIRQHTELHQQIRKTKGMVTLERPAEAASTSDNSNNVSSSVNGYRGVLPGNSKSNEGETGESLSVPPNGAFEQFSDACRTRPFQKSSYRKRKLLQTANVHTVSKKAARPSSIKCGCQWPMHPCALCTGRPDPTAPRDLPDTMMLAERVALLDPGYHPVLSFPEDVSSGIHIEATARIPDWQARVQRCTAKSAIKGVIAAQKAANRAERSLGASTSTHGNKKNSSETKRKYTKKQNDGDGASGGSSTPVMANKLTKNSKKHHLLHQSQQQSHLHRQQFQQPNRNSELYNHLQAPSSSTSQHHSNFPTKNNKIRKISSSTTAAPPATTLNGGYHVVGNEFNGLHVDNLDGAANGAVSRSRNSSPTHNWGNSSYYKNERTLERKNRNSYDIDNIVIPYSVAATTRVELLQYKEIPTPKWRIVEDDDEISDSMEKDTTSELNDIQHLIDVVVPSSKDNSSDNNIGNEEKLQGMENASKPSDKCDENVEAATTSSNDGNALEDITDDTVLSRHERALIEERKKFQTFLKFPYSTRSRANRRIDSRAESSGTNTPDPASPAPNTPSVGGDQESIPSPAAPSTPLPQTTLETNADDSICNPPPVVESTSGVRIERKRTVSTKKDKELNMDDHRRSSTPDLRDIIPPYEPLQFPLTDEEFEEMLKFMPTDHQITIEDCLNSTAQSCDEKNLNNNTTMYKGGTDVSITGGGNGGGGTEAGGNFINSTELLTRPSRVPHPTGDDDDDNVAEFEVGPSLGDQLDMFAGERIEHHLMGESDTESIESGLVDDDPNDPEWKDEPE